MTKRITIGNLHQLINIFNSTPALLNVPSFKIFNTLLQNLKPNGRECAKCKANKLISTFTPQFDISVAGLDVSEKAQIKQIMQVDEVCFYIREGNTLKLACY